MNRYIFTVTTGRSGQTTLSKILSDYSNNFHVGFEEPQIRPFFPRFIGDYEKKFRRKYIESNELLGRGKVLRAFENYDVAYLNHIAKLRIDKINNNLENGGAKVYIDISKFFARGLHVGFINNIEQVSLIHLVRDPISNMRSFMNRNKDFKLDNSKPNCKYNIFNIDGSKLKKEELYLWAWFELYLRFEELIINPKVVNYAQIMTESLSDSNQINLFIKKLNLGSKKIQEKNILLNSNVSAGLPKTKVSQNDVAIFNSFIKKVPDYLIERISYLEDYNPLIVHEL